VKKLIPFLIFSLSFKALAGAPANYSSLRNLILRTTSRDVIGWVNGLVKESAPSRMIGHPGHERAVDYLKKEIAILDPKNTGKLIVSSTSADVSEIKSFYQKDFDEKVEGKIPKGHPDYLKWFKVVSSMQALAETKKGSLVQNITWEKAGLDPKKMLVIAAHYDTISHDKSSLMVKEHEPMPGANYNASGVAVALGLIRTLAQIDLNYSVRVVFLDWQGIGFHGSYLYARELKGLGKEIMGIVNLEMIGQDTSYFDKTKKNGNMCVYLRNNSDESRWVKKLIEHGSQITTKVSFEMRPNGFENSDNFRFWDAGFLSSTFSQNWEEDFNPKFYQTSQDTPETLNHETLWHSYQYVTGAVVGTLLDLTR
jgi:Zn-dependent M28 family amino/carboxypeptidase